MSSPARHKSVKSVSEHWSSPGAFVLAGAGFAIGLKNIWLFPHHLALYGGSAFLLTYMFFLLALGVPLLMTQLMLGRLHGMSPVRGFALLASRARAPHYWRWLGAVAVAAGFLVLSYYNVVAGWLLAYAVRSLSGALSGLTSEATASIFIALIKDPEKQLFWHSLFVAMTFLVVARGVRHGIERVAQFAVPLIFLLLLLLVGYAAGTGSFVVGAGYFLRLDFSQMGVDGVLVAVGDAFFSLGLGFATFMTYGAYLPKQARLLKVSLLVVLADLLAGLLAGFAIFPVLFAGGGLSTAGPGLVFQTLAAAFDSLPLGEVMRAMLFVLLVLIAWVSTIGLAEPVVAWGIDHSHRSRASVALRVGAATWLLGVIAILSLHPWAFSFSVFGMVRSLGLFDVLVTVTSFLMLPFVGIALAVFAGWLLRPDTARVHLGLRQPRYFRIWYWANRLLIPALLVALLFGVRLFL